MRVVVFGGSGFLGRYIVEELYKRNYKLCVVDNVRMEGDYVPIDYVWGDITDEKSVDYVIRGADVVYNLAAMADIGACNKDPVEAVKSNILGNTIILDACVRHKVKRFVFSSSLYAHSRHGGVYASTKRACEDIIKNYKTYYNLNYTILQYGTLYGVGASGDNSVSNYLRSALKNKKIKYVGNGEEVREYIHVIDAAKLGVDILDESYTNKTIIISGHYPTKVKDLFTMIQEILGEPIEIEYQADLPDWKKESHYKVTPYSYNNDLPQKLISDSYVDMGLGMLNLLESMKNE